MEKKINLEEIINKQYNYPWVDKFLPHSEKQKLLSGVMDACRQVLQLAAENAKLNDYTSFCVGNKYKPHKSPAVDKQSILDTINQIVP